MPDHYFTQSPESAHRPGECQTVYREQVLSFETDAGVFSRDGIDKGTALLLDALPVLSGNVLDLGCGWGAVGLSVAKAYVSSRVTLVDINSRAVELCNKNAHRNGVSVQVMQSDGFSELLGEKFSFILTNPPIRAGKQVIYDLFAKSADHLLPGGSLYLVIRKQQGAPSALTYLNTFFPKVQVVKRGGGFWVIKADT